MIKKHLRRNCLFILFLFISTVGNAQKKDLQWARQIDGLRLRNVTADSQGNFYLAGSFKGTVDFGLNSPDAILTSNHENFEDGFILKLNSDGNFLWVKQITTTGPPQVQSFYAYASDIYFDSNGDILVSGNGSYITVFDPENENATTPYGMFLARYSADGDFLDARHILGLGGDTPQGEKGGKLIRKEADGSMYFSGGFLDMVDFDSGEDSYSMTSLGYGYYFSPFLLKVDASGNFLWATSWYASMHQTFDHDGNLFISGEFNGTLETDILTGNPKLVRDENNYNTRTRLLAKINPDNGDLIWIKRNTGGKIVSDNEGHLYTFGPNTGIDLDPAPSGMFVLPYDHHYIQKLTNDGNFVWGKGFGGETIFPNDIIFTPDNGFYIVGNGYGKFDLDLDPGKVFTYRMLTWGQYAAKYSATGELQDVILGGGSPILPLQAAPYLALWAGFRGDLEISLDPFNSQVLTSASNDATSYFIARYIEAHTSCPSGILRVSKMAQLNLPPGCIRFDGSIIVEGEEITSLDGLQHLEQITGNLVIRETGLSNLNGLQGISAIGKALEIINNPSLSSLNGLGGMSSSQNNSRTSNIRTIENLIITGNPALANCAVAFVADHLNSVSSASEIANNGENGNCNSAEEIIAAWEEALPVTLASFKASPAEANSVRLDWTTTEEAGASHFEAEHSLTGKDWSKIGEMKATGNNSSLKSYTYIHTNPSLSVNYYRLKSVDLDGSFAYSAIESIRLGGIARSGVEALVPYPNPVSDRLYLKLANLNDISGLKLYSAAGNLVKAAVDTDTQSLDVRHLPAGVYLLKVDKADGTYETFRVLISR